jgi:hypothetical protein
MQIHELTKRQKQIDEGLLSGLKAAVNVAKTGADKFASAMVPGYDDVKDAITTGKSGYAKGAEGGKGKWAGIKQAAKNLADPRASAQSKNARLRGQAEKDLDDIDAKYGIKSKRPLGWYKDQVTQDPESQEQRKDLIPKFDKTFDLGPALPDSGRVLTVSLNNAAYYKDGSGKWYQEPEADTPDAKARPITNASSVQALEDLIDNDQYSQISPPPSMGGAAVPKTKSTKQTQPAGAPATNQPQQSGVAQGIQEARRTTQGITKQQPNTQTVAGSELQKAAIAGSQATQAVGDNRSELQKAAAPGSQAQQQVAQNPNKAVKPGAPLNGSAKPTKSAGKLKLRKSFEEWIAKAMPEYNTIANDTEIKRELKVLFNKLLANKDDINALNEIFKQYLITVQAGVLRAKDGKQGGEGSDEQSQQSDIEAKLAQLRGKPIKTDSPELSQILKQIGIQTQTLSESQVAITKDIVVKTKSGDYVKRHTDQQWYDPNGVRIDPDKYADYIARLDKTPAAQTRYQADAGKGSADSFIKSQQTKAPELDEPEQHATAADWEAYKAQQNAIQNQLIDQTVNDLRNAEYFKTGQEHYLQQQLAQLMAKKF